MKYKKCCVFSYFLRVISRGKSKKCCVTLYSVRRRDLSDKFWLLISKSHLITRLRIRIRSIGPRRQQMAQSNFITFCSLLRRQWIHPLSFRFAQHLLCSLLPVSTQFPHFIMALMECSNLTNDNVKCGPNPIRNSDWMELINRRRNGRNFAIQWNNRYFWVDRFPIEKPALFTQFARRSNYLRGNKTSAKQSHYVWFDFNWILVVERTPHANTYHTKCRCVQK